MLIIFEGPDKTGKSTLSKRLAKDLEIPYIKLNNINIKENEKIDSDVSISTHSQLETVVQLHENGLLKDAILDRFHISEVIYSNVFNREYDIDYLSQIDNRLKQFNDVIVIYTYCRYSVLKNRLGDEKLLSLEQHKLVTDLYDDSLFNFTTLPTIVIDTSEDEDVSYMKLVTELYQRGIYENHPRPRRENHIDTMMKIAHIIAKRSPDLSRQVGAVITENGYIVGVGYNGPPSGLPHDTVDIRKKMGFKSGQGLEFSRAVHAEQNAMMQSGIRTYSDENLELYCTDSPCIHCMRQLIQIGIKRIYYTNLYNDKMAIEMANEANVELIQHNK